jgi:hypothetical protein
MQSIHDYQKHLKIELNSLIEQQTIIEKKINEQKFSYELKRKNFFEIISNQTHNKIDDKSRKFAALLPVNVKINNEYINTTIRNILKI